MGFKEKSGCLMMTFFLVIIIFLLFCSTGTDLNVKVDTVSWLELPESIKKEYNNYYENRFKSMRYVTFINLTSKNVRYSNTAVTGVYPGREKINIGNRLYYLKWSPDRGMHPYIITNDYIYSRVNQKVYLNYDEDNYFRYHLKK